MPASPVHQGSTPIAGSTGAQSGASFDQLLQTMPWGVLALAPDGTVAVFNPVAEALWGVPAAAVLGLLPAQVQPVVLPPDLLRTLHSATATPSAATATRYWLPHTQRWITQRAVPASDGSVWVYWDDISAQVQKEQTEADQATSAALLKAAEDAAQAGSYEADLATLTFRFSDGLFRLFGEEPQSSTPGLFFVDARSHPDDALLGKQLLAQLLADRKPYRYLHRIYRADGQMRTLEVHSSSICNEADEPVTLIGLVLDVTERQQAETALLKSKEVLAQQAIDNYRTLFNSINEGFALIEMQFDADENPVDGCFLEVNSVFERHTCQHTIVGKRLTAVMPSLDPAVIQRYGRVALTGTTARFEQVVETTTKIWYSVHAARVGGENSRQIAVVFDDISEHKRAEEALRRSAEEFGAVANLVPDLLWRSNADSYTDWYNQRWFDYTGKTLEESVGNGWTEAIHPDDRAHSAQNYQQAVLAGRALRQEHRIRSVQGEYRWFQVQILPFRNAQGAIEHWFGSATDIHERKQAEQQLHEFNAALERQVAERTQALRESIELQEAVFRTVQHAITVFQSVRNEGGQIIDFQCIFSNEVADRHLGRATTGHTVRSIMLDYLDEESFRRMVEVAETGQPTEITLHFTDGDQPLYLRTQYNKLRDGVVLVHENITERKKVELALQESRDLLQSVYDTSLISMSVLRAVRDEAGLVQDFTIVSVNKKLEREAGRTDLVGKLYAQEYPGVVQSGLYALMLRALETGEPQSMEYYYPYEGFNKWYSCMFVRLDDGIVATNLDITGRKQAEEEEVKNLALLQQAEDVAQLGNWEYNLRTASLRWSAGMYRLFALPLGTIVTPHVYLDLVLAEDRPLAEQLIHKLTEAPSSFEKSMRLRVAGQVKTVHLKAVLLYDSQGRPERLLGVDLDISTVRRLEEENLRMRLEQQQALFNAVQQAQETERKRIAEGLHNGVGQILYATKLRLDQFQPASLPLPPALATARREADRLLGEAIRQTRALSHELVPLVLEEFGLVAALQDISRSVSTPQLRLHCYVNVEEGASPLSPSVQLALYRIAQELAQNIVKHAKDATEASLSLETIPGFVLFRAEDNGVGFRADSKADKGMGLRTIRDRVTLLGGTIDLGSSPTYGTYVRIRIPLSHSSRS